MSEVGRPGRGADAAAVVRAEVARLRQGLDRVEAVLGRDDAAEPVGGTRSHPERYYRLLVDVYESGRHGVAAKTFTELGRGRGYDTRGLGGFFVGNRAALRRRDGRVVLTPNGQRLVGEYLSGVGG